jgi:pimeloyl-ACP methyl ester carboxylesterase
LRLQPWPLRLLTRAGLWLFRARHRGIVPSRRFARWALCHDLQPEDCRLVLSHLVPEPQALLMECIAWPAERVQAPATYIRTLKDRIIRPKTQLQMARTLPGVELIEIPVGHAYPVLYPQRLVDVFLGYL